MEVCSTFEQSRTLLQRFCEHTKDALEECLRNFEDGKTLDYIAYRLELIVLTVMQIEFTSVGSHEFIATLRQLLLEGHKVLESLLNHQYTEHDDTECLVFVSGQPDHPSFEIGYDILLFYIENGFNVRRISEMLGVSRSTVFRRLRKYGLSGKSDRTFITDDELDKEIYSAVKDFPYFGIRRMKRFIAHQKHKCFMAENKKFNVACRL